MSLASSNDSTSSSESTSSNESTWSTKPVPPTSERSAFSSTSEHTLVGAKREEDEITRDNLSENEMDIAQEDETTPANIAALEGTGDEAWDRRLKEINIERWLNDVEAAGGLGRDPDYVSDDEVDAVAAADDREVVDPVAM